MRLIRSEDAPQKVNTLLVDKWGIGLFRFAQVFAVSPVDQFLMRTNYPFSHQEIKAIKRNLKKMGDDLLKRGRLILKITERLKQTPVKETSDEELIKHMRLERFFKEYIRRHRIALRYLEKVSLQGKRGSGINKRTIIALGWGNLISESSHRIDWKTLGNLYDWLWERVAPYEFYKELKAPSGLEEDLRHQYNRYRWPGGTINFLVEKLKIPENQVFEFILNFILHQFFGGKEIYFKGKITADEFPKLFLNFLIDAFLGSREGLTLFSKNQSLADPMFLFLYFRLQKMVGEDLFPNLKGKNPPGVIFSKDADWPYKASEIDEYFNVAINLFLDHKVELGNPPPLIIFPDKSSFSTGF